MAFDFPVMPRIFYSLRAQQAGELIRILSETTEVPPGAGWGVFLRNHDELTLEMVSEEYRQAMYGWYAYDPRMRSNIGIRRRLAPLLDNSRAELELAHALLFALKGSPFLYYGDEIGMGDNIWLPDRDSSRTPMQWNPDRNAGFSSADPGKLYSPVVQSLVYNFALVNVESQLAQSRSLLHWIRNVVHVRKAHPAFGLGDAHDGSDATMSRCSRSCATTRGRARSSGMPRRSILCVFSFSHNPVSVEVDASSIAGSTLTDLFGGGPVPDGPGRRQADAHARHAGLLLAAHRPPRDAVCLSPIVARWSYGVVHEQQLVRHPRRLRSRDDGNRRRDESHRLRARRSARCRGPAGRAVELARRPRESRFPGAPAPCTASRPSARAPRGDRPRRSSAEIIEVLTSLFDRGLAVTIYNAPYDLSLLYHEALRYGLAAAR